MRTPQVPSIGAAACACGVAGAVARQAAIALASPTIFVLIRVDGVAGATPDGEWRTVSTIFKGLLENRQ
jgi:hypothetical protein